MEVKKSIFLKAALITLAVFVLSIYVGYTIESNGYNSMEERIGALEGGVEDSMLFSLFLQTHNQSEARCTAMKSQLDDTAQRTYDIYGALEQSGSTSIFRGYEQLRNKYFLANMRFYLMLRQYKQECNDTPLKPILFFYSAYNDCPSCAAQGKVLDALRYECKNVRVYAFPADVGDISIINTFKSYYGINATPSVVVEDRRYDTLVGKDELKKMVSCQD